MTKITIKDKDYILSATTRDVCNIEDALGYNLINMFIDMQVTQKLPKVKDVMIVLHGLLQKYNHGISLNTTMDLFDDYCAEGHDLSGVIELIIDALKDGGIIKFDEDAPNM